MPIGDGRVARVPRDLHVVAREQIRGRHVFFDHMHRDVTRAFIHHLHVLFPSALGQLALRVKFGELRFVIRVGD